MSIVSLNDITHTVGKGRRERVLFSDFSLSVEKGQTVVITGPSGSGKTTLLSIIGTLIPPSSGTLMLFGNSVTPENKYLMRKRLGFVFQTPTFIEDSTTKENIWLSTTLNNKDYNDAMRAAEEYLRKFDLSYIMDMKPKDMSGGERQRFSFILAFLKRSEIIIADEPLGSLDPKNRELVKDFMLELKQEEKTFIIATHDLSLLDLVDAHISL